MLPRMLFALLLTSAGLLNAQSKNLDIYWIDVEGGASTLIVSPSGESMLIDTGWTVGDRDAKRIYAATQQAGLKKIDYLLISHFHADHVGGLAALSKMIPIGRFFDHGDDIEKENQQWLDSYRTASAGKRTIVKPGDEIPLKGIQAVVVATPSHMHRQIVLDAIGEKRVLLFCAVIFEGQNGDALLRNSGIARRPVAATIVKRQGDQAFDIQVIGVGHVIEVEPRGKGPLI